ncbi:hypothetical protein [Spirochaeta cellobiosiphila]|uniref:hypothetical protein n=1 Tax=Spirochaeta cellobiosiphila TaxID=504483 RepID=UPI00040BD0E0|nr:hypothetical protein [Spirochaeta cellobiosiphila]
MNKIITSVTTVLLLMILNSCASTDTAQMKAPLALKYVEPAPLDNPFTVEKVGWVLNHYDKDFWIDPEEYNSLEVIWSFAYTGDFESLANMVIITGEDRWGPFSKDIMHTDAGGTVLYLDTKLINNFLGMGTGDTLRTKNYQFVFSRNDGSLSMISFNIPAPGEHNAGDYEYITIAPSLAAEPSYAPMLSTAENIKARREEDKILIDFTIDSEIVYNGYVICYDDMRNYVGISYDFRNKNQSMSEDLNSSQDFRKDGSLNNLELHSDDIILESGYTMDNIEKVVIVLTDGNQYQNSSSDCKSFSAAIAVE